ncbi:outer membrane beta-barrel protein [Candidatus Pantoea edessiphila]|uniref:Outer membrane protein X n=1 Tax=Candidatus Pantoea edessiphila TaxID=2044610 RepID=A0A2P5SX05_9GAMM|nr:outer membrane beta-barrel protein [Candidatus Pantoea edessiphila]PPI86866.1 outer membrane protein OmpX [Candidatus Pantoea edessiphila]
MKKFLYLPALICTLILGIANANITVSGGTAHGNSKKIPINSNGFNIRHRYENSKYFPISWMNSFVYTKVSKFENKFYLKSQYYSIDTGLMYRLNSWSSIYGGMGLAYSKFQSRHVVVIGNKFIFKRLGLSVITGIQFNPVKNFVIDIGVEKGIMKSGVITNIIAGIGYNF